jgi:hypothetical protein
MNYKQAYINFFECFAQIFVNFAVKKKIITNLLVLLISILSPSLVSSQSGKLSENIISIAEELAADDSDPEAAATFAERLYELSENPVKLNSTTEEEISRLFFLSDFQVKALADYAHSSGRIISIFELVNIPGFDKETVEMMNPFIDLSIKETSSSDTVRWRNTSITNLSVRKGNDTTYIGSPYKILSKYKFTAGSFSGGLTIEKDPGEKLLNGNPSLPDFLSANLSYRGNGMIRKLIVGDYSARFGQGTNLNTGIRTGLSLTAQGYMSATNEIKPYTSTDENNFFRGMAAEFSLKSLNVSILYSTDKKDGTLGSLSGSSKDYIENFYTAGIHNTSSLLQKKDAFTETTYGINLSYNFNNIRLGLTWTEERFSLPVIPEENDPANIFDFAGKRKNIYTFSYTGFIKKILTYGEISTNEFNKYAIIQGLSLKPSDRLTINLLLRDYNPGFMSFHGKGPGSSSKSGNEKGILGNFSFEAAKHLFISSGCDVEYFPWIKYRCSSPSLAMKQEIRVRFLPTERLAFDGSYNYRFSMFDEAESPGIPQQEQLITKSFKGAFRYSPKDNLTLGTRIDYKIADPSGSRGMLLLEDINYKFRSIPFTIWMRYCIFDTDDFDSRLYTWENDLLYSFSIPALFGKGSRTYFMTEWKIKDKVVLRIKYAISSKNGILPESKDTEELRIQLKLII